MNMTFKEKSQWIQLISILLVFGSYFLSINFKSAENFLPNSIYHFIWLIAALVILNIIGHALTAALNKPEGQNQRNQLIELKATRIKSFLLAAGIITSILISLKLQNDFYTVNFLFLALVGSETVEKALQIMYYRNSHKLEKS